MLPSNRFELIYNRIDHMRDQHGPNHGVDFRRAYGTSEIRVVVLQVCTIIPEKGLENFLRAMSVVLQRNQEAHFVFGRR